MLILVTSIVTLLAFFIWFFTTTFLDTNYYNKISFKVIGEHGNRVENVEIWGVTPINELLRLNTKGGVEWGKTDGLFKEFRLVGTPDYMDSVKFVIAYISHDNATDTINIQYQNDKYEKISNQKTINFRDESYISLNPFKRLVLVIQRIFERHTNALFSAFMLLAIALILIKTRLIVKWLLLMKIAVSVLILIFVLWKGNLVHYDTASYEFNYFHRPMIYPVYLFLLTGFLNLKIILILINSLLGIVAASLLSIKFCRTFNLGKLSEFFGFIVLLIPYVSNKYLVANYMIAENIAYPLFLFFIERLINAINCRFAIKSFIELLLATIFLVLVRGQFIFVYILISCIVIMLIINKHKKRIVIFLFVGLSIAAFNLIDSTYHYIVHGKFHITTFGGSLLAVNAFYNSTPSDSCLFEGNDRVIFNKISAQIEENKLRKHFCEKETKTTRFINYLYSYDEILWRKGFQDFLKYADENRNYSNKIPIEIWNDKNDILMKMAIILTFHNLKSTFDTAFLNLKQGCYLTGWAHVELILCIFIVLVLLAKYQFTNKKNLLILGMILSLHIINLIFVSFLVYMTNRYMFYTKFVLVFALLTILCEKVFYGLKIDKV